MWKILFLVVTIGIATSIFTISTGHSSPQILNDQNDYFYALEFLQKGEFEEALALIQKHEEELSYETLTGRKWVDLFVSTAAKAMDHSTLLLLYQDFPEAFENQEEATLLAADAFLRQGNNAKYWQIRDLWNQNIEKSSDWLFLDVDAFLLAKQPKEAIRLLQSFSSPGKNDSNRLIRLALLSLKENPKLALDYLSEAELKDPTNTDIHIYRANFLESLGKKSQALAEYSTAVMKDSKNIFLKDQLADFYLRHGQPEKALNLWIEGLKIVSVDSIWIKALFWERLLNQPQTEWHSFSIPSTSLQPLIDYLRSLPEGRFWNEKAFRKLLNAEALIAKQPALFWLKLIDFLHIGEQGKALALLKEYEIAVVPPSFPYWVAVQLTESYNTYHGYIEALKFAVLQESSDELLSLIGQLLEVSKNDDSILAEIVPLAKEKTERGLRFSWLLSLIYIERENYEGAFAAVMDHLLLKESILGKETLARIALLQDNMALADKIYNELEGYSSEAKSYLAKQAFDQQDWKRAKDLTEELLERYPDNPVLLDNLRKILQEAAYTISKK